MDKKRLADELSRLWRESAAAAKASSQALDKWRANKAPWPGAEMQEARLSREHLEQFTIASLPEIIAALRA